MPRPKMERHPLPKSETRELAEAEKTILTRLADGDKSAKVLGELAGVAMPTLHKHLRRLKREHKIEKSPDTGAYRITEDGLRTIGRFKVRDGIQHYMVDGIQEGKPIPFLVAAGYADRVDDPFLQALIKYRCEIAFEQWVRFTLGLAKAKRILSKEYFDGPKHWDEISVDEWTRIQREVLSKIGDVAYGEDVTPKDLIAELMKTESKDRLRKMSEYNRKVPDFIEYLSEVSGKLIAD